MLMSVQEHTSSAAATTTTGERSVYQSLFDKINLAPVSSLKNVDAWQSDEALSDAAPAERVTAAIQVLVSCLADATQPLERLDKTLLDDQIARLDKQISDQVNEVMHHAEFQKQESLWRGLHSMIMGIDFRRNVRVEMMDISKDALRDDFDDAPELIQSGLYRHVYIEEYDQPGGEPIAAMISAYEFDNSPQDIALLRNISGVSAACHMPFIGAVGPKFFLKDNMEDVAAIKDINDYFERAEYIKWKAFRDSDDSRYIGLTMPRVLGRLPYGPDTVPVRSFNYVEEVKGPDHDKYLWTSASFSFAVNMVKSFIKNGWCVQIRGPQAGGAVKDLPIHLYDLGTGNQVKIPSEVMIPETREFEFANLGFIPLSYYKNRDYACFFSANSAQKPAQFDTPEATANSRINSRLPYIFLLSRIAHYLKILQRENIGTTKDRRLLELELNNWLRSLVTEMTDPGDDLQASHPLRDGRVVVEDIEDTRSTIAGVYTRKAWEEEVLPAIEKVVNNRREEVDQVLGDDTHSASDPLSPEALKARLSERYFTDFAGNWQDFLNSLRWKRSQTLSDAIDQLTLITDVRQSPLVALMNTLSVQGRTGFTGEALSDSLVKSAKDLFKTKENQTINQHAREDGPMADTFSPVLALMDGKSGGQDLSHLSLQTYLTRVTQVRLKLQQVTNAADPQGMSQALAQTVFQGKTVDLTTTRDYGNLVAASLGQAWSGFGQTLFVQPLEQSWQQVLQPTAAGLNAQWKALIVNDWNNAFGGRYPFSDVGSEVSLPLLAQYLRNDNGRIPQFLESHLSGVLHKQGSHWVPDTVNAQGLVFDPVFLEAMDTLSQLADVAFTRGEAGLRFELRPGTARDVMQTDLVIDGQKLTYVNQMPIWKNIVWPADTEASGATLSWVSTKTGTRIYSDNPGTWGWIRLLEKAEITDNAGVNSGFNLRWTAQDGLPLNYTLRTEAGDGPLALLQLRYFELPENIFVISSQSSSEEEE
jgi:type VI secretion system ImpC/EvpB family protein